MSDLPRHSVSVAAVAVDDNGRALLVQRRDNGRWEPPGGVLELDEPIEAGAEREALEETGVGVRVDQLTGVYKNMRLGVVALVFRAHVIAGTPTPTAEGQAVRWFTRDEVKELLAEVYAVRVLDALDAPLQPKIRHHDGVHLHPGDQRPK
jgi:8-oxo-dGTP diphosphatase